MQASFGGTLEVLKADLLNARIQSSKRLYHLYTEYINDLRPKKQHKQGTWSIAPLKKYYKIKNE
ncbi:hypothetical protein RUM44_009232 [Polyplax serrata]|uniref:Uncharacterized protein n=1 Tax=Polyplax serrata TaxID=468196 RepID=A0ABR1AS50_POLSC